MNVELTNISGSAPIFVRFITTSMRLCKNPFSAMVLRDVSLWTQYMRWANVSDIWVENIYLRPGTVAAIGGIPRLILFRIQIYCQCKFENWRNYDEQYN